MTFWIFKKTWLGFVAPISSISWFYTNLDYLLWIVWVEVFLHRGDKVENRHCRNISFWVFFSRVIAEGASVWVQRPHAPSSQGPTCVGFLAIAVVNLLQKNTVHSSKRNTCALYLVESSLCLHTWLVSQVLLTTAICLITILLQI